MAEFSLLSAEIKWISAKSMEHHITIYFSHIFIQQLSYILILNLSWLFLFDARVLICKRVWRVICIWPHHCHHMMMFVVVIREHRLSIRVYSTKIRIQQCIIRIIFVAVVIIIVTTIVVAIIVVFVRRRTTVHNNLCVRHFRSLSGIVVNLCDNNLVVLGFCVT